MSWHQDEHFYEIVIPAWQAYLTAEGRLTDAITSHNEEASSRAGYAALREGGGGNNLSAPLCGSCDACSARLASIWYRLGTRFMALGQRPLHDVANGSSGGRCGALW